MTTTSNLQTGYIATNQARLYYESVGTGDPLVLLYAGIADRRMWDEQMTDFAPHFQVIRYDVRGYGNSTLGEGDATYDQDLYDLLQGLGIDQAILLGCSQGGTTAIDFALAHPAMTLGLILVSATPSGYQPSGEMPPTLQRLIEAYQQHDMPNAAELSTQIWFDGPERQPNQMPAALRTRVREMMQDVLATGAADMTGERFAKPPALDRLSQIQAPTLVIVGDHDDPSIVQAGDLLVRQIPNAEKVVIPNAAHLLNLEQPALFQQVVLDFLQSRLE